MGKILIVTAFYPPCEKIGAKRPYNIANYLAGEGWEVTVLTLSETYTPPIGDVKSNNEKIKIIRTEAFLPYIYLTNRNLSNRINLSNEDSTRDCGTSRLFIIKDRLVGLLKGVIRNVLNKLDLIDEYSGWYRHAIREIKKQEMNYDIVLGTVPPYSVGYIALKISQLCQCKLVIDYRDPWNDLQDLTHLRSKYGRAKINRHKKIEEDYLSTADLLLTVSPGITNMLEKRTNTPIVTIPQGYVKECVRNPDVKRHGSYFLYAGSLAYGRDLSLILSAIKRISEEKGLELKLIYCGEHTDIVKQQAAAVDAAKYLEVKGYLREKEALELAAGAIANLIIISSGYEYAYPGKLFDLLKAERPICVIADKENEAGKLVEAHKLGVNLVKLDEQQVSDALAVIIGGDSFAPEKLEELSTERLFNRLSLELERL